MENTFIWYPTGVDFAGVITVALIIAVFVTLFIVTRIQKPEEPMPPGE